MNIKLEVSDVARDQFDAIVRGGERVEVILHCSDGKEKMAVAVRVEDGRPRGFLDVSKE